MTCRLEGCDSPVLIVKRQLCRIHYQRWQKTGSTDLQPRAGTCEVDGCNVIMRTEGKTKCYKHNRLTGTGTGGHNKIEGECDFEGCDRKRTGTGFCQTHKAQHKNNGFMWPIGTPRPGRTYKTKEGRWNGYMGSEYTPERTCVRCNETKDWKRFCLGADHLLNVCRDCHRIEVTKEVDLVPVGQGKKTQKRHTVEDALAMLNRTL